MRESRQRKNWIGWVSMMSGKTLNSVDAISDENIDNEDRQLLTPRLQR